MENQHCEKHEFAIDQQGRQIDDLYDKLSVLATIPGKVDTQTQILKELVIGLQSLSEHKAQIAVLAEVISDYKLHKVEDIDFKKKCADIQVRFNSVDIQQIKDDHNKVVKMETEWHIVKYVAPILATIAGGALGWILDKVILKVSL